MLSSDNIILNILTDAKNDGNPLLKHFKIGYPSKELAQMNNTIMVAVVSTENQLKDFEAQQFRDLVEILVVTKQKDNKKAIRIIKTASEEICRLIMANTDKFPNPPVIRNINPFFEVDLILSRGQIMVNVNTEPVNFNPDRDEYEYVCDLINENNIDEV